MAKFYERKVLLVDFEDGNVAELENSCGAIAKLDHIHLLKPYAGHPVKSQSKEQLLIEIQKYLLSHRSSNVVIGDSPLWPNPSGPIPTKIANRANEIETFLNLYSPNRKEKALFLWGESNRGKTTLINEMYRQGCAISATACAKGDFKNSASIDEVIAMVSHSLSDKIPELEGADTDSFRERLASTNIPTVLLFDTFEDATTESVLWIETVLLPFVGRSDGLRVVVAGQAIPKGQSSWSEIAVPIELLPIKNTIHWRRYRDDLGKIVLDDVIQEVVDKANGEPGIIGPQIKLWTN